MVNIDLIKIMGFVLLFLIRIILALLAFGGSVHQISCTRNVNLIKRCVLFK